MQANNKNSLECLFIGNLNHSTCYYHAAQQYLLLECYLSRSIFTVQHHSIEAQPVSTSLSLSVTDKAHLPVYFETNCSRKRMASANANENSKCCAPGTDNICKVNIINTDWFYLKIRKFLGKCFLNNLLL